VEWGGVGWGQMCAASSWCRQATASNPAERLPVVPASVVENSGSGHIAVAPGMQARCRTRDVTGDVRCRALVSKQRVPIASAVAVSVAIVAAIAVAPLLPLTPPPMPSPPPSPL